MDRTATNRYTAIDAFVFVYDYSVFSHIDKSYFLYFLTTELARYSICYNTYKEIKKESNNLVLRICSELREIIERSSDSI
jgi:predicted KAP-like P-loop ATPase